MVVLDSSFLIDVLHGQERALQLLQMFKEREARLFVASLTVMELWEGVHRCKLPEQEKEKIEGILSTVTVLPFHEKEAKIAAHLRVELSQQGKWLELADLLIASITQAHGETLVTKDKDFARIPGLFVLSY